jgi:peptidoglycan hydrolase CwlO-like protein
MLEQVNNNNKKQTPFLKRVADLENSVKEMQKEKTCSCVKPISQLKKEVEELKKQVELLRKSLKR